MERRPWSGMERRPWSGMERRPWSGMERRPWSAFGPALALALAAGCAAALAGCSEVDAPSAMAAPRDDTPQRSARATPAASGGGGTGAQVAENDAGVDSAAGRSSSASSAGCTDCPLYDWMTRQAEPALETNDMDALAARLEALARWAPPGYPNWASIARDGADAARAGAPDAVRAACRGCHVQHQSRYVQELRARRLP